MKGYDRKLSLRCITIFFTLSGGSLIGAANVHAESSLEEIVVTAQRRAENLQKVPISISAFSAKTMEQAGITGPQDLSIVTPALELHRGVSGTTMFLRGVGSAAAYLPGFENSVATYVDGVYIDNSIGNIFSFNSVERVEVLKGPQGTLFGRNATGGLVHVITKAPEQEFAGKVEVSYGDYDTLGAKFYATGGLSETVAADLAVYYSDQGEGYGENLFNGDDVLLQEEVSVRGGLLWDNGNGTSARVILDYADWTNDFGISRQPSEQGIYFFGAPNTGDFYNTNSNISSELSNESKGVSLTIKHNLDSVEFTSITAYREAEADLLLDQDATPLPFVDFPGGIASDFFSQEIRLVSTNETGLQWIAGLFYMQSTGEFNPFTLQGLFLDSLAPGLQSFNASAKQDTESYSAFVQATYDLSESTSLTGGLRWTNDDRELTENGFLDFGVAQVAFPELKANDSWDEPTWRLALDHQLNDNALVFASYNRGFKSGAYATSTAAGDLQLGRVSAPVDPEILDAYEVGFKVDFPESALRLNGALFFYEYENLQFERVEGGIASILNAAEAEILGAELEMNWLAADKFEIRAGLSYIDGEYTEFPDAPFTSQNPEFPFGNATTFGDASGNSLVRTPDYTFNIGGVYTIETAMGILALSGQYAYNDGFPWEVDNRLVQESYDIVNAEVSLASRDDSWRVRLFGKNLFGEEYSIYSVSASFGDTVSPAAPRTWGVSVGYNF